MRPITSSLFAVFAIMSVTAAEARPFGGRSGITVRASASHVQRDNGRRASFGRSGFRRGYIGYGYGAYATAGSYGYGGYAGPLPGAGYLGGPYGPLIVPGYGGIPEAPVQPPAIYVIDTPSASASRRRAGRTSATLASLSGRPERAGTRVIQVSSQVPPQVSRQVRR